MLGIVLPATAADLKVSIGGLRSTSGNVNIALFDTPATFAKSEGVVMERIVPATATEAVFDNVPPGTYAIASFHDENASGEFDTNFLGLPLEGYCFSNGARPFLSAPPFEAAAFILPAEGMSIALQMIY